MSTVEFFTLVTDNMGLYFTCLGVAMLLYFFLFRKIWVSIFDPLVMQFVSAAFSFSVVTFLYATESIDTFYLTSYLTTQTAFIFGFLLFSKLNITIPTSFKLEQDVSFNKIIFVICSMLVIFSNLSIYARVGIPLFLESRLDIAVDSGGWGLISRFAGIASFIALYYCYYFLVNEKEISPLFRKFTKTILFCLLMFTLLSGSKAAFIVFPMMFFLYSVTQRKRSPNLLNNLKRKEPILIVAFLVVAVGVVVVRGGGAVDEAALEIVQRFVGSGDAYWMSYPDDMLYNLDDSQGFKALFAGFLGPFRIVPWEDIPNPIGVDLYRLYYDLDSTIGANARHNVFGLLFFGSIGSVIFSFILGLCLGFVRSLFINASFSTLFRTIVLCFLYLSVCSIETDATYVIGEFSSLFMTLVFILTISVGIYFLMHRTSKTKPN